MHKMVKKVAFLVVGTLIVNANSLDTNCLNCHKQNKLPTKLMYKRYLMKYSTQKNIKDGGWRVGNIYATYLHSTWRVEEVF